MLDGEREVSARRTTQVQIRVAPSMELGGATQRLTGAHVGRGLLGVMNDEHGEFMTTLQLA